MKLQTFDYKQISTRNFIYIKQKLSEVISQGSSGSVVKDTGIRYGGPWFELWYIFFPTFFAHFFYPVVTALLEYLDPVILHLLSFITLSL